MGTFAVKFVVSHSLRPERRVELEGLVDTGALFTQIPEQILAVETATMILCGRPKSLVLLGATTLETLGFGVDPIHKTLIPIDAPMATAWPAGSVPGMIGLMWY